MGKKNKPNFPNPKPLIPGATPASAPPPSGLIGRMIAATKQVVPVLKIDAPNWNEDQLKDLWGKLPSSEQQQFQVFIDQFAQLGSQMKDAHERYVTAESDLEAQQQAGDAKLAQEIARLGVEQQAINERQESLGTAHELLRSSQTSLELERGELQQYRLALTGREELITVREAEFRGGLVADREQSLVELRKQVAALETLRNRLPSEMDKERQTLLSQARLDAQALMASAEQHVATLHGREIKLNALELELDKRNERQVMNEELLRVRRESLTKEIQERFQRDLEDKDAQLQRRLKELDKLHNRLDQQQAELDGLESLRDQVGGDPQQILDELDVLRQAKRTLDREVQALRASRSEDDSNELRSQRDRLQESLTKNESELFELRHRESEWRSSVTEQQDWQKTRKVLEKNRELLHDAVDRLQNDVDSMLSKQKENTVFPELNRMDLELIKPIHTDPVPELKHLVAELQARILYAEPNKMLHFRKEELQLFLGGLAMSQLHIFQGISGTGKTSLATAFAKAVGGECTIVPVQAGWRDRADLLGHFNAFEKRYYERNTLQALYRAQTEAHQDRLHIVLLDEMNLSRPEQYFAEFLSAMELGESDRWINLMESRPAHGAPKKLRNGRDILLPPNLWFIGTANHDETTNAFADKTHDRAFVLELPRQDTMQENIAKPKSRTSWGFESLNRRFNIAHDLHKDQIAALQKQINQSSLTRLLSDTFKLGWGNRLESQMKRFVPVVMEAGGSAALAVDHLLGSRMFRDGKVIGRHDVNADSLHQVADALSVMWKDCALKGEPTRCLAALNSDIERLDAGR
jgi:hypothetical protein